MASILSSVLFMVIAGWFVLCVTTILCYIRELHGYSFSIFLCRFWYFFLLIFCFGCELNFYCFLLIFSFFFIYTFPPSPLFHVSFFFLRFCVTDEFSFCPCHRYTQSLTPAKNDAIVPSSIVPSLNPCC